MKSKVYRFGSIWNISTRSMRKLKNQMTTLYIGLDPDMNSKVVKYQGLTNAPDKKYAAAQLFQRLLKGETWEQIEAKISQENFLGESVSI